METKQLNIINLLRKSMGLKSDLQEEDKIIGEDQPDGLKSFIKKTAEACGLKPKAKDKNKTPHSPHVEKKIAVSPEYKFNHPMRGHMVIILNDTFIHQSFRAGAKHDFDNMKEMAAKLGYMIQHTHVCHNYTKSETIGVLNNARSADHSQCDSFALMISTHGLEQPNSKAKGKMDHALICADDQLIFTSTITHMFNDENCPALKGKPKLFFIQACRGKEVDEGVLVQEYKQQPHDGKEVDKGVKRSMSDQKSIEQPLDASTTSRQNVDDLSDAAGAIISSSVRATAAVTTGKDLKETNESLKLVEDKTEGIKPSERSPKLQEDPVDKTPFVKCDNDQLVFYAIPTGKSAWRSKGDGSWMIKYLHTLVIAHFEEKRQFNLLSLLTRVSAKMSLRETYIPGDPKSNKKKSCDRYRAQIDQSCCV